MVIYLRFLIISAVIFLGACHNFANPMPKGLRTIMKNVENNPKASPEYKKGWREGCESGMSSWGNYYYKAFHNFTHTPELLDNKDYSKSWADSFHACRSYVNRFLSDGVWWGESGKGKAQGPLSRGGLRMNQNISGTDWPFLSGMGSGNIWPEIFNSPSTLGWGKYSWGGNMGKNNPGSLIFLDP